MSVLIVRVINNMKKYVYLFIDGSSDMNHILGGKGANLAEMTNLNIPVPCGLQFQQKRVYIL